jgi:hypothetical protein
MQIAPEPSSPSPAPTIVIDPNSPVNDISSSNAGSSAPTSPAGYDLSATSMGALSSSPTSPTSPKPHLKRDIDGSIARAITKHAEAKARNAKKKFGKNTAGTTAGTRGEPKKTQTHHDEAFYNRPWTRAYYGTLLSVVEKSGGGSKNLQIRRIQYWLPIAEMLIQVRRVSLLLTYVIWDRVHHFSGVADPQLSPTPMSVCYNVLNSSFSCRQSTTLSSRPSPQAGWRRPYI